MAITVTISGFTAPQGQVMGEAWGKILHPGTNATKAEVEAHLRGILIQGVKDRQHSEAIAAVPAPPDFDTV
jgi:hypothetical protein